MNELTLTVVLIHGGFVDGSGWEGVYNILKKDGYNVAIVQNPTTSLADDVAFTQRVIAAQPGKTLLVGHSYGGAVITEAGTDPNVAGLVYVAAFAPDKGESVASLIKDPAPGAPVPPSCRRKSFCCWTWRVRRVVRSRRERAEGQLHGRLASSVGCQGVGGRGDLAGMAIQAQLVPRCLRRQDDPAAGTATDGPACRLDRQRSARQSRRLRFSAAGGRRTHREGGGSTFQVAEAKGPLPPR